jgi:hypothetical protein
MSVFPFLVLDTGYLSLMALLSPVVYWDFGSKLASREYDFWFPEMSRKLTLSVLI